MQRFEQFLGDIDHLLDSSTDGKAEYVHPALKNLGCVSLVLLREVIAPVVFRNAEEEITDIEVGEEVHVRAVPNKFKYPERGRGLQILRFYEIGGRLPQNKTVLRTKQKPSEAFDLNALVFGDSANQENRVLPVKAAVNYSDALSLLPKHLCVEESFHNRAAEDGTLFDAESKRNSENLFTRHFVKPGTFLVQVLSTRGKVLPPIGLDHLLLCLGLAGAYGGQTSVTGTNIRTHVVGLYGARFERAETSPYELVTALFQEKDLDLSDRASVTQALHRRLSAVHPAAMEANAAQPYLRDLVQRFESDDGALQAAYRSAAGKVGALFDAWFGTGKE
jgi:CRISPR type I-D-associated protein Csc2